jgi:hypothetical protein
MANSKFSLTSGQKNRKPHAKGLTIPFAFTKHIIAAFKKKIIRYSRKQKPSSEDIKQALEPDSDMTVI